MKICNLDKKHNLQPINYQLFDAIIIMIDNYIVFGTCLRLTNVLIFFTR
jgi:hypothetical protein